jgi:hypothetical protein
MEHSFNLISAYIDPGSGSLLLQMILASCAGFVLYFRKTIGKVFQFFKRDRGNTSNPE